jgi:hypothetical protein
MEPQPATAKKSPTCPRCGNRLRLLPDQIGSTIICPKCNASFAVGRPRAPEPAVEGDAYEPEIPLKRSSIVSEDESAPTAADSDPSSQYDADWSSADNLEAEPHHVRPAGNEPDYLEQAKAKGMLRPETEVRLPKWTFFSGVFFSPWQGLNLTRWAIMALGLALAGSISIGALDLLGFFSGHVSTDAMMGLPLVLVAVGMLLASLSFSAASFLSAVQDTADGFDQMQEETMPELGQWIFTLGSLTLLWTAAGALGYPLSFIEGVGPLGVAVCSFVFFPILLLSAMECDSFLAPYSPAVLRTLLRFWWGWLLFYLLTTPLLVGWLLLSGLGLVSAPYLVSFASGPALAAIILIYARLLGRVAWRASGMPAGRREGAGDDGYQPPRSGKRKKKRRRMRVAFPGDLEAAARHLVDDPPASDRVNSRRRGP